LENAIKEDPLEEDPDLDLDADEDDEMETQR
jgi:hypothetical protein